jgi:nucleoside-diphosphate-sugar epimerase
MNKRVNVLLGGAGLIGSALDRKLRDRGEETRVYDLKTGFDLREHEPPDPKGEAYYWFLAWDAGGAKYLMDRSQQRSILRHNLSLCERVFGWFELRQARFTFVSSQLAGYPNAYGTTKAIGETWAGLLEFGLITRLWNCYDAEESSTRSHVIPDFVVQAKSGKIRLLTSGEERRQFLHADDVADALIFQRQTGQVLADVTSGTWVSVVDVAKLVAKEFSANVSPSADRGYENLVEPARLLEGWQPSIDLPVGIPMVIERMRKNGWM